MAFKQGFRWKPADVAMLPVPIDSPPVSAWSKSPPIYPSSDTCNTIPVGHENLGLTLPGPHRQDYPDMDTIPAIPWSTGPVPTNIPEAPSSQTRPSTRSKSRGRPSKSTSSTERSNTTSTVTPADASPSVPPLTMAPVTPQGVPGSSRIGLDMVSF